MYLLAFIETCGVFIFILSSIVTLSRSCWFSWNAIFAYTKPYVAHGFTLSSTRMYQSTATENICCKKLAFKVNRYFLHQYADINYRNDRSQSYVKHILFLINPPTISSLINPFQNSKSKKQMNFFLQRPVCFSFKYL